MKGARMGLAALILPGCALHPTEPAPPVTKETLGKLAFADPDLSQPRGVACAGCHDPGRAFSEPDSDRSTSMGAVRGRFGPRNTPTAMYARFAPRLFWDGRASSLEEQARGPLMNPLEMANPDEASVADAVRHATYASSFTKIYGADTVADDHRLVTALLDSISAYERTPALAPFSSKYDHYLAGQATLTAAEQRGLAIFEDPARGNCASCHPSRPGADGAPPLFTNFSYANLGIPKYVNSGFLTQPAGLNPDGEAFIDRGLGKITGASTDDGKFRVPSLRNIARTGPYGHNGYFENLPYLLSFLATRDVGASDTGPWAAPEVSANVEQRVGHLPLSKQDLDDLDAFLETLTDAR
jgi:cytochrome c peroxidase